MCGDGGVALRPRWHYDQIVERKSGLFFCIFVYRAWAQLYIGLHREAGILYQKKLYLCLLLKSIDHCDIGFILQ